MATTGPARWPGTSTFPNTNEYPGQGDVPFIRCLVSFDDYTASTRSWTDYSSRLRAYQTQRGRPTELATFDAGTAEIVLENRDRQLDPVINTSIRPMNKVWLYAEWSGQVYDLFVGYAEAWQQTWPDGGWSNALTSVRCVDESKIIATRVIPDTAVLDGGATVTTGQRIDFILQVMMSNRAPRVLEPGVVPMATYTVTGDTPCLEEIQMAVRTESENAAFFVTKSGGVKYDDGAGWLTDPVLGTFDDDGTDLPYLDAVVDYSDSFLFNRVTVNGRVVAASDTQTDTTSLSRYGSRTLSVSTDPFNSGWLSSLSGQLVAKYKDPATRVTTITPNLADANTLENVLARDLTDKIEVFRTPPGGGARIDQVSHIQSIAWTGEPGQLPSVRLGVSPL